MSPAKKKILIVAGEASGDLHGSGVVRALLRLSPDVQVYGVGSGNMRQAGAELIIDSSQLAVVGITEVFGQIGNLLKGYWQLKQFIKTNHLSLLILIDFPDFNLMLARVAKGVGVPVLYYISPQVWAWRSGRVQKIAKRVDKMAVILPFEVAIFRQAGLEVEFVGHPLLDVLNANQHEIAPPHTEEWRGDPLIALLPGSRVKEVNSLLPSLIRAAEIIGENKAGARFILAVAPSLNLQEVKEFLKSADLSVTIVQGQTYQAIKAADLVIVASGTATLETAILGKPMVILYRVSSLSYWIGKILVKTNWIGLVNIVAGRRVVPELLQHEAKGERIAAEVLKILEDESARQEVLQGLAEVRDKLGTPGAAERVAQIALKMIGAVRRGVES
ncbi:MAG: lipid-A-disaccharide synthase [Pseudomonadota bacterium]